MQCPHFLAEKLEGRCFYRQCGLSYTFPYPQYGFLDEANVVVVVVPPPVSLKLPRPNSTTALLHCQQLTERALTSRMLSKEGS
jgi:hypothetical protein